MEHPDNFYSEQNLFSAENQQNKDYLENKDYQILTKNFITLKQKITESSGLLKSLDQKNVKIKNLENEVAYLKSKLQGENLEEMQKQVKEKDIKLKSQELLIKQLNLQLQQVELALQKNTNKDQNLFREKERLQKLTSEQLGTIQLLQQSIQEYEFKEIKMKQQLYQYENFSNFTFSVQQIEKKQEEIDQLQNENLKHKLKIKELEEKLDQVYQKYINLVESSKNQQQQSNYHGLDFRNIIETSEKSFVKLIFQLYEMVKLKQWQGQNMESNCFQKDNFKVNNNTQQNDFIGDLVEQLFQQKQQNKIQNESLNQISQSPQDQIIQSGLKNQENIENDKFKEASQKDQSSANDIMEIENIQTTQTEKKKVILNKKNQLCKKTNVKEIQQQNQAQKDQDILNNQELSIQEKLQFFKQTKNQVTQGKQISQSENQKQPQKNEETKSQKTQLNVQDSTQNMFKKQIQDFNEQILQEYVERTLKEREQKQTSQLQQKITVEKPKKKQKIEEKSD